MHSWRKKIVTSIEKIGFLKGYNYFKKEQFYPNKRSFKSSLTLTYGICY